MTNVIELKNYQDASKAVAGILEVVAYIFGASDDIIGLTDLQESLLKAGIFLNIEESRWEIPKKSITVDNMREIHSKAEVLLKNITESKDDET